MNPRREVVPTSPSSLAMEREDLLGAYLAVWIVDGTKADDGERRARAVHAADRREEVIMVAMFSADYCECERRELEFFLADLFVVVGRR